MKRNLTIAVWLAAVCLLGQTYPPANPPDYQPPPLPIVRGGEIKDPQTGMIYKRVTLPGDIAAAYYWGSASHHWYDAGNFRACTEWTLADGGYLCSVPTSNGGPPLLYWVHGDTGAVQFRGVMFMPSTPDYGWSYIGMESGSPFDHTELGVAWQSRAGWLVRGVYQDPGNEIPQNTAAKFVWTKHVNLKAQFDLQYPGKLGPGGLVSINGDWMVFRARMYNQDSPGTLSVFSKSQGKFIGFVESWSRPECRWCGLHANAPVYAPFPIVNITVQTLCGGGASGPYASKLTAAVTATDTSFLVDGEPQNEDPVNGPRHLQTVAVGDIVGVNGCHGGEQERMTVTAKSGNTWTMKRGLKAQPWPVGTRLVMQPGSMSPEYWYDPLTDKLSADPNAASAHRVTVFPWDADAQYAARKFASAQDLITKPWAFGMPWIIKGTETGYNYPAHQRHPSLHAPSNTLFDVMPVYNYDKDVPNKMPQAGALLRWKLDAPVPKDSVEILGHMLSASHKFSITANVHPLANGKWVMGEAANQQGIFLMQVSGTATPPPPQPLAPVINRFDVSPISIVVGGTAVLSWQTTNTTDVTISGIGVVVLNGNLDLNPATTTMYTLTATGSGGTTVQSLTLAVTQPPPPDPLVELTKRVAALELQATADVAKIAAIDTELQTLKVSLPVADARIVALEAALARLKAALQ